REREREREIERERGNGDVSVCLCPRVITRPWVMCRVRLHWPLRYFVQWALWWFLCSSGMVCLSLWCVCCVGMCVYISVCVCVCGVSMSVFDHACESVCWHGGGSKVKLSHLVHIILTCA